MQIKYALESTPHGGCYYTGMVANNGTPVVWNNIDRAVLYDVLQNAILARESFRHPNDFQIREIVLARKVGQIVG